MSCSLIDALTATSGFVHNPQGCNQRSPQADPSTDPQVNRATVEHVNPYEMARVRNVLRMRRQRHGYVLIAHGGMIERQNPAAVERVIRQRGRVA